MGAPPHRREDHLQVGRLDFLIGQVWQDTDGIARATLFRDGFAGLVRPGHALLSCPPAELLEAYLGTPHVLFSEVGQVPRNVDAGLDRIGRRRQVSVSVPSLDTAAEIVRRSDDLMNMGERVAAVLEARHGLRRFTLPIDVPAFDVAVSWADRNEDSALTRWFREIVSTCVADDA